MVGRRVGALLAIVVALASLECTRDALFVCDEDAQCVAGAGLGRCEADRRCSYPDDDCESRRRYGQWAGELSGQCVEPGGGSSSSNSSVAASESSSSVGTTTATVTSSEGPGSSSGGTPTSGGSSSSGGASSSESTGGGTPIPLGHWPLDEGKGEIAYDMGSGGHDGVIEGGAWIEGHAGGGVGFTVDDHGIEIAPSGDYDLVGAPGLTLMGWARIDDFVISNPTIIAKFNAYGLRFWGDAKTGIVSVIYLNPDGGTADGDTDGPLDQYGGVACTGPNLLLTGAKSDEEDVTLWHHYAATYDVESRMLRLYFDGAEVCGRDVSSEMLDGTLAVTANRLQLGRWQTSGPTLLGGIDDVRIYDEVVSADVIVAIAAAR